MASPPVAVVFGTRPEAIKLAGVIRRLDELVTTIHSGQHFTPELAEFLHKGLDLRADLQLEVGGVSRGQQIGQALEMLSRHFETARPRVVVVQGDTNTALAGGLAANACEVPLVHVEAGLRSFDRHMPEEHNRVLVDHLADVLCAPTETAAANLRREGLPDERVTVTGNTVVDAVLELLPPEAERREVVAAHGLAPASYVLATFHRPENVDVPEHLATVVRELAGLGAPVVLPLHPRTAARASSFGLGADLDRLLVRPPCDYRMFLALASECALLVSDSGGVQEEASVLKRPVVVVRNSTERPEVLATFATLVPVGPGISKAARTVLDDVAGAHARLAVVPTPYGDGRAAERTAAAVLALLDDGAEPTA